MDKNNAVDEFLGDLKNDGNDEVFEKNQGQNLFENDNIVEEKGELVEKKDEKPLPFHKDPKVLKFIEKEVAKRTAPAQIEEQKFIKEENVDDDIWTRIIGNDTPEKQSALRDLKKVLADRDELVVSRAIQKLELQKQADLEAEKQAQEELENGFEAIEETFNVDLTSRTPQARKTRGEFIEFIERIAPKDKDGQVSDYPDFEEAFRLFQERKKPEPNAQLRKLASRGMARSGSGDASQVSKDRDYSWKGVEKIISSIVK